MVTEKSINPKIWQTYFSKAKEFFESMQDSFKTRKWNTVGLTAVHCVISLSDALLAHQAGIRNTSQDHRSIAQLLRKYIKHNETIKQEKHLTMIIAKKNLIAYEGREFTEKDAIEIMKHTERFFDWAKQILQC